MAEQVILEVQIDDAKGADKLHQLAQQLADLKQQQSELNKQYADGKIGTSDYIVMQKQLAEQISFVNKQTNALVSATKLATDTTKEYGDSLNDERRKLADMQKAYAALTKEERESAKGREFQQKIQEQNKAVLEAEKGIGQFQRNVGNYASALEGLGGSLGGAVKGMQSFSTASKSLMTNPLAAFFAAIVLVVKQIVDAFQRSEERMNQLKTAVAPLQPILDLVTKAFDGLAKIVSNTLVAALDGLTKGIEYSLRAWDALVSAVTGNESKVAESFKAVANAASANADAEIKYTKARRDFVELEAKLNNENAKLQAQYAEKDKYTAEQRIAFLQKINENEKTLASTRVNLAKQSLQLAEYDASRAENDAETNDRLAQARADVTNAETEYYNAMISINKKMSSAREEMRKESESEAQALVKMYEDIENANLDEIEQNIKAEELELEKQIEIDNAKIEEVNQYLANRQRAREMYDLISDEEQEEAELLALQTAYENRLLIDEEYEIAKKAIQDKYREKKEQAETSSINKAQAQYSSALKATAIQASAAAQSLSDLFEEWAENNSSAAAAQKALALTSILVNEAISISEGAQAMAAAMAGAASAAAATGPAAPATFAAYTAQMVGAVLSVVASVAATIVQAKQVFEKASSDSTQKYALGGIVGGSSYVGDNVTANVNSGEMILNKSQQSRLFDIANGGVISQSAETYAAAMANAVAQMPAPVMCYDEFKSFERESATYTELATI